MKALTTILLAIISLPLKMLYVVVFGLVALIRPEKTKELAEEFQKIDDTPIEPLKINLFK